MEGILLFSILFFLSRKTLPEGVLFGTFIGLYGLFRTIGELFRQPDPQLGFLFGPITMGQVLSVPMILIGAAIVYTRFRVSRSPVENGHLPPSSR
jgi:phosphatidylglycerol:prolipoprotein diacylglycerol transferase